MLPLTWLEKTFTLVASLVPGAVRKEKERMLQDGKLDSHPTSFERLPTKQWTRLCHQDSPGLGDTGWRWASGRSDPARPSSVWFLTFPLIGPTDH